METLPAILIFFGVMAGILLWRWLPPKQNKFRWDCPYCKAKRGVVFKISTNQEYFLQKIKEKHINTSHSEENHGG